VASGEERGVGWRQVLLLAAAIVLAVIVVGRLTQLVGAVDDLLGFAPLVIVGLVAVTFTMLYLALRPRRP
jgi:multisubunit Na+/H+ antiporter MnhB subunit